MILSLIKRFWKIAVSIGLLGALAFIVDLEEAKRFFVESDKRFLVAVVVVQMLDRWFMAWKWSMLVNCIAGPIKVIKATKLYFICGLFGLLVPLGGIGPDVIRFLKLEEFGVDKIKGLASIIIERFLGVAGTLVATGLSTLCFVLIFTNNQYSKELVVLSVVSLVLLLLCAIIFRYGRMPTFIVERIFSKLHVKDVLDSMASYKTHVKTVVAVGFLSFIEQGFGILAFFFAAKAIGFEVGIVTCMIIIPIAAALARMPISLWGLGVREGIEIALFVALEGANVTEVASASLLMTILMFVAVLPGLYWWYFDSGYSNARKKVVS